TPLQEGTRTLHINFLIEVLGRRSLKSADCWRPGSLNILRQIGRSYRRALSLTSTRRSSSCFCTHTSGSLASTSNLTPWYPARPSDLTFWCRKGSVAFTSRRLLRATFPARRLVSVM